MDVDTALQAAAGLQRRLPTLEAAELMLAAGVDLVSAHLGLGAPPVDGEVSLLIEVTGDDDPAGELAATLGDMAGLVGSAVAREPSDRARLWRYRDGHTDAIAQLGTPIKLDVALPRRRLGRFLAEVEPTVAAVAPAAAVWLFGHVGDGNIHVNVTGAHPNDTSVDHAVLDLVLSLEGAISAEHGIGRAKVEYLANDRDPGDIDAFRVLKSALDPDGILNPGVLLAPG